MRNIREDPEALNELKQLALNFLSEKNIQVPLRIQPELGVGLLGLLVCKDFLLGLLFHAEKQEVILANFSKAGDAELNILISKRQVALLEFDGVEVAFYYLSESSKGEMDILYQRFIKV